MADRKITALSELSTVAASDVLPIVDISEAADASKNKKVAYSTLHRSLGDGTNSAPSVGWTSDSANTGFYRPASHEIGITNNTAFTAKFTADGLKLGGAAGDATSAQLHISGSDETDQILIENTATSAANAPDLVLWRNSSSPADNDFLGQIEFRGEDDGSNTVPYAQIIAQAADVTNATEDGNLLFNTISGGTAAARLSIVGANIGIAESSPDALLHVTNTAAGNALVLECSANDGASGGDITIYNHRGSSAAGQADDISGSLFFRSHNSASTPEILDYACIRTSLGVVTDGSEEGVLQFRIRDAAQMHTRVDIENANLKLYGSTVGVDAADADTLSSLVFNGLNDNGTPQDVQYASIQGQAVDVSDGSEDGRLNFKCMKAGTLTTQLQIEADTITLADATNLVFNTSTGTKIGTATGQKLAFFNATPVVQQSAIANITSSASSGTLPTANGSITISNASTPTVAELQEYCVELESKLESVLAVLRTCGLIAT